MPDKIEIVTTINSAEEPITLSEVAKKVHTTASSMGPQMARLKKEGLLDETDTNHYVLSDKGKEWLQNEMDKATKLLKSTVPAAGMGDRKKPETPEDEPPEGEEDIAAGTPPVGNPRMQDQDQSTEKFQSEVDAGLDDFNVFYQLGLQVGVEKQLCQVVSRHVWKGGRYDDLVWVRKAFGEMVVRADLADRWWQAWRTHLGADVKGELITKMRKEGANSEKPIEDDSGQNGSAAARNMEDFKKTLTHSIIDDVPKFMGEGEGDMTYEDAKKLCEIRAASKAKAGTVAAAMPVQPVDPTMQALTILEKLVPLLKGDGTGKGRTFLVKPSEDGGEPVVQELDPDQPIVAPAARVQQIPGRTFVVDNESGDITEVEAGKPYVKIIKEKALVPSGQGGPQSGFFFYNPRTHGVEQWDPSKGPFMIPQADEAPVSKQPVIQLKGADGELMNLDLSTYFALDEHKEKMKQKREGFEMKQGLAKEAKTLLSKGIRAFSHMAGESEEELLETESELPAESEDSAGGPAE